MIPTQQGVNDLNHKIQSFYSHVFKELLHRSTLQHSNWHPCCTDCSMPILYHCVAAILKQRRQNRSKDVNLEQRNFLFCLLDAQGSSPFAVLQSLLPILIWPVLDLLQLYVFFLIDLYRICEKTKLWHLPWRAILWSYSVLKTLLLGENVVSVMQST